MGSRRRRYVIFTGEGWIFEGDFISKCSRYDLCVCWREGEYGFNVISELGSRRMEWRRESVFTKQGSRFRRRGE
jgi:hypothetical protein